MTYFIRPLLLAVLAASLVACASGDSDDGQRPADCSNVGCGAPPLCSQGCQAVCGCCPCADGTGLTIDAGSYVCTNGCYSPGEAGAPDAGVD